MPVHSDELRFWTLDLEHGVVHVDAPAPARDVSKYGLDEEAMEALEWLQPRASARCGLTRLMFQETTYLHEFADDRLCVRCVVATPEAERVLLFDHPTPT